MSKFMNFLTSRECKAYLESGGDLIFVPFGRVERLGPHLPLGTRNIVVSAIARLMAEKHNGLFLPTIPYGTVYNVDENRGNMDITPEFMHEYCMELCGEITANGFKRIIFVSFQEELYYLSHDYFQKHNVAVIYLNPDSFFGLQNSTVAALDSHGRELWRLVACLHALGNKPLLEKVLAKTQELFGTYTPVVDKGKQAQDKIGKSAHKLGKGQWQFYPVNLGQSLADGVAAFAMPDNATLDKAAAELHEWIDNQSRPIADLAQYQNYLDGLTFKRPI